MSNATAAVNVETTSVEYNFNKETGFIEISADSLTPGWVEDQGFLAVLADIKEECKGATAFSIADQIVNLAKSKKNGEFKVRAARGHGTGPRAAANTGGTAAPRKTKKDDLGAVLSFLQDPETALAKVQALREPLVAQIAEAQEQLDRLNGILAILQTGK